MNENLNEKERSDKFKQFAQLLGENDPYSKTFIEKLSKLSPEDSKKVAEIINFLLDEDSH